MPKKLILDTSDELWDQVQLFKQGRSLGNNNEAVETLLRSALEQQKGASIFKQPQSPDFIIDKKTADAVEDFYMKVDPLERIMGFPLMILIDKRSDAVYTECHISAEILSKLGDVDAVIDPVSQEEFRANRELQPKKPEFKRMEEDAKGGRQFSDIIIEYYPNAYRPDRPLKILGGQHRTKAITDAFKEKAINRVHGIRIYFNLNKNQRAEIAIISNTNIHVSPDLRDRIEEQRLEPAGKLRIWTQYVGLLTSDKDFGDKKTWDENTPTVRMIRSFIVNFYTGKDCKENAEKNAVVPYLCSSGGNDDEYLEIFKKIQSFVDDKDLIEAGKSFAGLHKKQIEKTQKITDPASEYKLKALNLSVISSWAFAAGYLQRDQVALKKLYGLPSVSQNQDPLNAVAMAQAKYDKIDPDTYRGLGTRTDQKERGRLLQLFILYAKSPVKEITKGLIDAAIKRYHANEANEEAKKAENLLQ